jgi:hypothetical protein
MELRAISLATPAWKCDALEWSLRSPNLNTCRRFSAEYYRFCFPRSTVIEFGGNVRTDPSEPSASRGVTFVGSSSEFSSARLFDVNTVARRSTLIRTVCASARRTIPRRQRIPARTRWVISTPRNHRSITTVMTLRGESMIGSSVDFSITASRSRFASVI